MAAEGKVIVITGSNAGIGRETAKELNLQGGMILMLCRSQERAEAAIARLIQEGCDASRLRFYECDLANFASVRACAELVIKDFDHIDILINNAGIAFYPRHELTVDGHELTWQSNHLSHFLLTQLLLPLLQKAPRARIIFVSSGLHYRASPLDLSIIDSKEIFSVLYHPYARSKLANIMTSRELSKRLGDIEGNQITVNSLDPGSVATEISKNMPVFGIAGFMRPIYKLFLKTEKRGAATSIYCAISPEVKGATGGYYDCDSKKKPESRHALDEEKCRELYEYSMRTVGLTEQK